VLHNDGHELHSSHYRAVLHPGGTGDAQEMTTFVKCPQSMEQMLQTAGNMEFTFAQSELMKRIAGYWALVALFFVMPTGAQGQTGPFSVLLQPVSVPGLPGLHSYVWGKQDGKWLIVGGRKDGLHRRQPTSSFAVADNNDRLYVVDPVTLQQWSAPLTSLPVALQEQLSSTNMEFHQKDNTLYCLGGYGYSATAGDHITYSNIVAIDLSGTIDAVINGTPFASFFRYQTDAEFAVTGGHLEQIYDTYYLVGGNKFDGRYNPMGGPSYTQVYTNQIRRFTIADDGVTMTINHLAGFTDAANLHRRDYNAVPQIMPDGKEGITAFSGVFQATADVPFLNCVNIDSAGYAPDAAFSQYYNHYHCASLPVYSASANEMHNVFFGGIAQYYDNAGVLTLDNLVPFVKTIARVTRSSAGVMTEYKLPVEMPGLLGAGSEFIYADGVPSYANHVLKLDDLVADTTLAGYIYGGINSSAPNIFNINTGTESTANDQLIKVYVVKGASAGADMVNAQSTSELKLQVYPNPNKGDIHISFFVAKASDVLIYIKDIHGVLVEKRTLKNLAAGGHLVTHTLKEGDTEGTYLVTVETPDAKGTQQIILRR
jgi:hypothetical protein